MWAPNLRIFMRDSLLLSPHSEATQKHLLCVQMTAGNAASSSGWVLPVANLSKRGLNPENIYGMTAINSLFHHCTFTRFLRAHRSPQNTTGLLLKFNYLLFAHILTFKSSLKGSVLAVLIRRANSSRASSLVVMMSSTGFLSSSSVRSMKWTKKSPWSIRK